MRVVSLCPSLTLTLFDLGLDETQIVGRTPWCIHPKGAVEKVPIVGGTKTPTMSKIYAAQPDLVVLDQEENPKEVYDELVANGVQCFVCDVRKPSDVPELLRSLGTAVGCEKRGQQLAEELELSLNSLSQTGRGIVLPMIWHEPLMAVSPRRYAGALIESLGFSVPDVDPSTGYPVITPELIIQHSVEGLLLSSEPHEFSLQEGEAIADAVVALGGKRPWLKCIDGEALTWMGSYTKVGIEHLENKLN